MNEDVAQERHWHWEFTAFDGEPDAQTVNWAVSITVLGYMSEADARLAVQDIVQRQQYRLRRVWECNTCGYQGRVVETLKQMADAAQ